MAKEKKMPEENAEKENAPAEKEPAPLEEEITLSEEEIDPSEEDLETEVETEDQPSASEFATIVMEPKELKLTNTGEISPVGKLSTEAPTMISPPGDAQEILDTVVDMDQEILDPPGFEEEIEVEIEEEKPALSDAEKDFRRKRWLQFPRRLLFSLIAFGSALGIIEIFKLVITPTIEQVTRSWDWKTSILLDQNVSEVISGPLEASLVLLLTTVGFALLIAIIIAGLSVLNNKFTVTPYAPMGSLLKAIARFVSFPIIAGSFLLTAFSALFIFVIQLDVFSTASDPSVPVSGYWLLGFVLSLLPGLFAGQSLAKTLTLPEVTRNVKTWLIELIKTIANLLDMVGGLISGMVALELIFNFEGIGRLLITSLDARDFPTAISILHTIVTLVAIHRVASQILRWVHRLLTDRKPEAAPLILEEIEILEEEFDEEPIEDVKRVLTGFEKFVDQRWSGLSRIIWVSVTVLLLLIPLGIFLYGYTQSTSRDIFNLVSKASTSNLPAALAIGLIVVVLSGLIGIASGFFQSKAKFWSESLADLLLLPTDIALMLPIIPFALVLMEWLMAPNDIAQRIISEDVLPSNAFLMTIILVGFLLAARGVRFARKLWLACPSDAGRIKKMLLSIPYILGFFLSAVYAGLWYEIILSFLGRGIQDIGMSFGKIFAARQAAFVDAPTDLIVAGILVSLILLSIYMLADALIGYFSSKEPVSKLFE